MAWEELGKSVVKIDQTQNDIKISRSNFEKALNNDLPVNGILMGISDGTKLQAVTGNAPLTLLASGARTVNTAAPTQNNYNAKGLILYLDVTAASGTGGLTIEIRAVDPVSAGYVKVFVAAAAITSTGIRAYEISPGSVKAGISGGYQVCERSQIALPGKWYAVVSHADASSYTYSLGAHYIV